MSKKPQFNPPRTNAAENRYGTALRKVARQVGEIVNGTLLKPGTSEYDRLINALLRNYAESIDHWAKNAGFKMLANVSKLTEQSFFENSKQISEGIKKLIKTTPTGTLMQQLLNEQVGLIKSIPLKAAERVHELTLAGISNSTRGSEIVAEILRTSEVSKARANLIARTEIARTSSVLTQARALDVGATQAIWRTAKDSDVRESHKEMEGVVFSLSEPPLLSDGTKIFPGQIYNCRCHMEPIIKFLE